MSCKKNFLLLFVTLFVFTIILTLTISEANKIMYLQKSNINDENLIVSINESGQTYGSALVTGEDSVVEPDLILVESDSGQIGYVFKNNFYDINNQPENPEEAIEYMKRLKKESPKVIPVYEQDGKTIIGEFTLGSK